MSGKVFLVGAGPGDPGLLTIKGRHCLEIADVIIYDYLADARLLSFARADAETIGVGKHGGGGQKSEQSAINALLISHATAGRAVVRLKGGDPFIFGRGGEEAEALARQGIEFEIVPGVSAGTAVPAYAGIPLTHREYSSSVAFVAGYEYPDKDELAVHWGEIARSMGTLVLFMTTRQLQHNMQHLLAAGVAPDMPAAVIRWGTTAAQETLVGTVATIGDMAHVRNLQPPALAVVGKVVDLRERLQWFEKKPLFGRRIVVTRARAQAARFGELIEEWGAEVIYCPAIELAPPESWAPVDAAIARAGDFDWAIFTSVNGVAAFADRLDAVGADVRALHGVQIAAIGPETAAALERLHLRVACVPEEYRAEGVVDVLGDVRDKRILLPRAAGAREVLPQELERRGATVTEVIVYRSLRPARDVSGVRDLLADAKVDLVTFTSSSTVRHFVDLFASGEGLALLRRTHIGCIGPITADTARTLGLSVDVQPPVYTIPAFAEAIRAYFAG